MPSVYTPENYQGRVNMAASYIIKGRRTTRGFDTCFEMYDGDAVAVAIYRRAQHDPALFANLPRYLDIASIKAVADKYAAIPDSGLKVLARELRNAMSQQVPS